MMMQQYGHQSVVTIDATFGTNENKVKCLIVIQSLGNLHNMMKHDCNMWKFAETQLKFVNTC
jgi:hypothetical protein